MKRRIFAAFLAAMLVLSLFGCMKNGGGDETLEEDDERVVYSWPDASGSVMTPFGGSTQSVGGSRGTGIIISAEYAEAIVAAADGEVIFAGEDKKLEKSVQIRHEDGYVTTYGYLLNIIADEGQAVKEGDVIGYAGAAIETNKPCLFFSVADPDGNFIDPMERLK